MYSEELGDAKCIPDTGHPEISEAPSTRANGPAALWFYRRRGDGNLCSFGTTTFGTIAAVVLWCTYRSLEVATIRDDLSVVPPTNVGYSHTALWTFVSGYLANLFRVWRLGRPKEKLGHGRPQYLAQ